MAAALPIDARLARDAALAARVRKGDQQSVAELVAQLDRYLLSEAGRVRRGFRLPPGAVEDLIAEARLRLVIVAPAYDPARGVLWITYAWPAARQAMVDWVRNLGGCVRVTSAVADGKRRRELMARLDPGSHFYASVAARVRQVDVSLDEPVRQREDGARDVIGDRLPADGQLADDAIAHEQLRRAVRRAFASLDDHDKRLLRARLRGLTLEQIGEFSNRGGLGTVSKEAARGAVDRAHRRLLAALPRELRP